MPNTHQSDLIQSPTDHPTWALAEWISGAVSVDFTNSARRWARHAILDWFGVTIAGASDPLVDILSADALSSGEAGDSPLVGRREKVTPSTAAMINGAASHALDYDDVNKRLHGHPTVPVVPALLALAKQNGATGRDVIDAFIIGYEVECLIGEMMGLAHYGRGWHATATIGTFGAAAGCARMLGLDAEKTAMALGIAATQAAGLKSMFGTMCKPLHAGKAAMNGLMAARLAAAGFTSRSDALECAQGFGATQSSEFRPLPVRPNPGAVYAVEENLFKYHAACYLIHSSIEAIKKMKAQHGFDADQINRVRTRVDAGHRTVCDIPDPETGLQVKFSIRHCIAMALSDLDTGDQAIYSEETANRPDLVTLRKIVQIEEAQHDSRHAAEVIIDLKDGRTLVQYFDVGVPADDVDAQETRLTVKFRRLADPIIGAEKAETTVRQMAGLDTTENLAVLMETVTLD